MSRQLTSLLPYYGGKRIMAPLIVEQLGPHNSYWEPFAGSMAVLLAKPVSAHEHANDLHGDLINLARVVQDEDLAVQLYAKLSRTLCHEELFRECRDWWLERTQWDGVPDVERAYRYFVVSWMGRNGVSGTERFNHSYSVCWKKAGSNRSIRFIAAVESLPEWHHRLRRVVILSRCGIGILENIEDLPDVAIYVDPPYLLDTRAKSGGGGIYQHDFAAADHVRLAEVLRRFRHARVVVSYYDAPHLAELYPGWTVLRPDVGHKRMSTGKTKADVAPEVLLLNGPVFGSQSLFSEASAHA